MKVVKLTTGMVPPRWLFLKMDTDEGISGWGERVLEGRAAAVAAEVTLLLYFIAAISGWVGPLITPRIGQRGLTITGFSMVFVALLIAAAAL